MASANKKHMEFQWLWSPVAMVIQCCLTLPEIIMEVKKKTCLELGTYSSKGAMPSTFMIISRSVSCLMRWGVLQYI